MSALHARTARSTGFRSFRVLVASLLLLPSLAFAQLEEDDDDIFGEEEVLSESAADTASLMRDSFFQSQGVSVLGSFTGTAGLSWYWSDPWGGEPVLGHQDSSIVDPVSSLALGFSAKPERNLSFYGELRTAWPFVTEKTVPVKDALGEYTGDTATLSVPDISVFKLYSKFDWADRVFFSFGKQPLAWGKGMFFTPANDLFALGAVNYDDPEAEREGPLSLRMNVPLAGNRLTSYFYAVMSEPDMDVLDMALAPKLELTLPSVELSLSAYWKYDSPWSLIGGGSWAMEDLSLFGEAMVSFGSDAWYVVREDRPGLAVFPYPDKDFTWRIIERPDDAFFTGTLGGLYSHAWEEKLSLSVIAQYLYDGRAQANLSLDDAASAIAERMDPRYPEADDPSISLSDPSGMAAALSRFGMRLSRHYGAVSVNAGEIFGSDVSLSAFCMANLFDLSGWVKPQVSWKIFDRLSLNAWGSFSFGDGGDEYTNFGGIAKALQGISVSGMPPVISYTEASLTPTMELGISLSLGSGSF